MRFNMWYTYKPLIHRERQKIFWLFQTNLAALFWGNVSVKGTRWTEADSHSQAAKSTDWLHTEGNYLHYCWQDTTSLHGYDCRAVFTPNHAFNRQLHCAGRYSYSHFFKIRIKNVRNAAKNDWNKNESVDCELQFGPLMESQFLHLMLFSHL